jgi:hypothetical protein
MNEYENHPASNFFPMMSEVELKALADDIEKNGLREPVELFQGKILDGRNRYLACKIRNIEATFVNLNGNCDSPITFVASKNLFRRHLADPQKAAIAAELEEGLKKEARKRQGERTDLAEHKGTPTFGMNHPKSPERSRAVAARLMDIGEESVKIAARAKRDAPEVFEKMKQNEITIEGARREVAGKGIRQGQREKAQVKYFEDYLGRILGASRGIIELDAKLVASQLNSREIRQRLNEYGQSSRKVRSFIRKIQQQKEKNRG